MSVLERLREAVLEDGGLLAATVRPRPEGAPLPLDGLSQDLALAVEAIHEGELLHHARGRVLAPEDPDLALLAGDRLYALGLEALARAGALEAIAVLADVIAEAGTARAAGDERAAAAAWERGVERLRAPAS